MYFAHTSKLPAQNINKGERIKHTFECNRNDHFYDCGCLACQSRLAFCRCSSCIERKTRFSGRFVDGNDYSKYPTLQQLVDLENR